MDTTCMRGRGKWRCARAGGAGRPGGGPASCSLSPPRSHRHPGQAARVWTTHQWKPSHLGGPECQYRGLGRTRARRQAGAMARETRDGRSCSQREPVMANWEDASCKNGQRQAKPAPPVAGRPDPGLSREREDVGRRVGVGKAAANRNCVVVCKKPNRTGSARIRAR